MNQTEQLEATRSRLARLFSEDRFNKREAYSPTFSVTELARMTKTPKSTLSRWVMEAGIGRATKRDGRYERVLTIKEIQSLADEFNWLK
jgi:hypothetical protein